MKIEIQNNIPIPTCTKIKSEDSPTSILRQMEVGNSVVVPLLRVKIWRNCARSIGKKIITRTISNQEARIWMGGSIQLG